MAKLDALIQQTIDADGEFQTSISSLSDDEKQTKMGERKAELLNKELASLRQKADDAVKAREIAENQKIRAEKAEAQLKGKGGSPEQPKEKGDLSPKDYLALNEAKVSSEDLDEVFSYASYKKLSVTEALKDKTMQTILKEKAEERATAEAVRMKGTKPPVSVNTGDKLLSQAEGSELVPDDDEGIASLAEARFNSRAKSTKPKI